MKLPSEIQFSQFTTWYNSKVESERYLFEKTDTLTLWVLGLSAGATTAIISLIDKLRWISKTSLSIILISFLATIVLGGVYRLLALKLYAVSLEGDQDIFNSMSIYSISRPPVEFTPGDPFEYLAAAITKNTGIDGGFLLDEYRRAPTPQQKNDIMKKAANLYATWVERYNQENQLWVAELSTSIHRVLGPGGVLKPKALKRPVLYRLKLWCIIVQFGYLVSFVTAIFFFVVETIKHLSSFKGYQ